MNSRGARLGARVLWATGLAAAARRVLTARGRFAIELHGVPSRTYLELPRTSRPSLAAPGLETILEWLSRRFRFLTPAEFLESDLPGVLLTFDDGFANNHSVVLPLLMKYKAPAIFFLATGHLGENGSWLDFVEDAAKTAWGQLSDIPPDIRRDIYSGMYEDQVRDCVESGLVTVGAHSVSHRRLTALDDGSLVQEIGESKATLERITGRPVDLFAYPFGGADERVVREVEKSGFRAAFVEQHLPISIAQLAIPRVGVHRAEPWYLAAKLSGLYDHPLRGRNPTA